MSDFYDRQLLWVDIIVKQGNLVQRARFNPEMDFRYELKCLQAMERAACDCLSLPPTPQDAAP